RAPGQAVVSTMRTLMSRRRQLADASSLPAIAFTDLRPHVPAVVITTPASRSRTEQPAVSAPRRGINRPYAGRAALALPPRIYRAATAQLAGLYPFLYGGGIPAVGSYIGTNLLTGAAFSCHPIAWLHRGLITNPNML